MYIKSLCVSVCVGGGMAEQETADNDNYDEDWTPGDSQQVLISTC